VARKISKKKPNQKDLDLVTDIRTTILVESPRGGRSVIWLTLILFVCAIWWASVSEVEEVTRGMGKVIPSSQIQVIQNLEGGILAETYVNIGDIVQKGQLLMRLDEKRFSAPFQEYRLKYLALTVPLSSTMTRSTRVSSEARWVTSSSVLPSSIRLRLLQSRFSVRASMELLGSSSIRMGGSWSTARARATVCRWPPDRLLPCSPTGMSKPALCFLTISVTPDSMAARRIASSSTSGWPMMMFSLTEPLNKVMSWGT
jgi:hypothetical protein